MPVAVFPDRGRSPDVPIEVAAEIAALLVGCPVMAQFDLRRVSQPVEGQDELAERLAAHLDDFAGPLVAGGNRFVACQAVDPLTAGRNFLENSHHTLHVGQLAHLIEGKAPGAA